MKAIPKLDAQFKAMLGPRLEDGTAVLIMSLHSRDDSDGIAIHAEAAELHLPRVTVDALRSWFLLEASTHEKEIA